MFVVGDHTQPVYSLAFAPDGTRLASAGKDGTARLWDLAGGPPLVLTHPDAAQAVAFDAAGDRLATGCADGAVRLWDPADGRELHALAGEPGTGVCGLAFLAAGRLLVSASGQRQHAGKGGGLRLWDLTESPPRCQRQTDPHGCWAVAATPGGKALAWGGGGKSVTFWQVTAPDRHTLPPLKKGVLALAMAPDGQSLAATDDWNVKLWDTDRLCERATLPGHKGLVSALAFSPDGRTLASGSWDTRVTFWDVATGRERQSYAWDVGRVLAVAFSPDGLLAAAAGHTGRVVVWDVG